MRSLKRAVLSDVSCLLLSSLKLYYLGLHPNATKQKLTVSVCLHESVKCQVWRVRSLKVRCYLMCPAYLILLSSLKLYYLGHHPNSTKHKLPVNVCLHESVKCV